MGGATPLQLQEQQGGERGRCGSGGACVHARCPWHRGCSQKMRPHLSDHGCRLFTHFMRQQVRKAMDMSRMMAQLTMEAITATLKPKVS